MSTRERIEFLKTIKPGQWLFTCSLQPKQFKGWDSEKNPNDYAREKFADDDWELFANYDDFTTMDGSSHSANHCGINIISKEYAEWFIKNECWNLLLEHEEGDRDWTKYENDIINLCEKEGIKYEGY